MNDYRLPKNIRQIGEQEDGMKIYLEDYVNTFIHRYVSSGEENSGGILLGQRERINGVDYLFIKGAIETNNPLESKGLENAQIAGKIKTYFPDLVVCGCFFFDKLEKVSRLQLTKMFEEHYQSEGQVLYYIHGQDEEFCIKDAQSGIRKLAGHYVYYERNEQMQAYMEAKSHDKVEVKPREPDIPQEPIRKERIRGRKKKRRESDMLDIVVRTVSLLGIFLLAFVIFSDQISITKIGSNNKSEVESVETLPVAASVVESESVAESESLSKQESESESGESSSEVNAVIIPKAYTILKGESIASISLKFYGTLDMVDKICELNEISNPDYVRVGQKIQLPKRE